MAEVNIIMTHKEIDRLTLIQQVECKQVTHRFAAEQLKLSSHQVRCLVRQYRNQGAQGLTSRHRGRKANNAIAESTRTDAMSILKRDYADFSPTFAHEKLTELHSFTFSVETLRQWMMQDERWVSKSRRAARIHQRRPMLSCQPLLSNIMTILLLCHVVNRRLIEKCYMINKSWTLFLHCTTHVSYLRI
mgnify:CR=1 FL=1